MRHIIAILAAMLALALVLPAIGALPSDIAPTSANASGTKSAGLTRSPEGTPIDQSALATTPYIASFLSNTWMPNSFVPPVNYALAKNKNNYTANSTNNIYDFLGNSWAPFTFEPDTQVALAQNKYGYYANSTPSNYQFLQDSWTPGNAVNVVVIENGPYTLHKMS
jgi:hypothetical protein